MARNFTLDQYNRSECERKKGNGSGIILHCLSHSLACELNLQLLSPLILRYSLLANKFGVLLIHKRVDYHKFVVIMFTQFSQVTFLKASFSCKKFMNFFNFEKKARHFTLVATTLVT